MAVNGWRLFYFRLFKERLDGLERDVTALAEKDPEGFSHHPKVKFLKAVVDNVRQEVPRDRNAMPDLQQRLPQMHGHDAERLNSAAPIGVLSPLDRL